MRSASLLVILAAVASVAFASTSCTTTAYTSGAVIPSTAIAPGGYLDVRDQKCFGSTLYLYVGAYTVQGSAVDSYTVFYGDQDCGASGYTRYSNNSMRYTGSASHDGSFGPSYGSYGSYRTMVTIRCDNLVLPCTISASLCIVYVLNLPLVIGLAAGGVVLLICVCIIGCVVCARRRRSVQQVAYVQVGNEQVYSPPIQTHGYAPYPTGQSTGTL